MVESQSGSDFYRSKVYTLVPTTASHVSYLKRLENNPQFDFWSDGVKVNQDVDIMASSEAQELFESELRSHGIKYSVMIENVER